jgi:exopolysaccharide biosynthesis WecB/TagA/CpsF family protein
MTHVQDRPGRVVLGGTDVDLRSRAEALEEILGAAREPGPAPLGVASANLDHVHHFGAHGRWAAALEPSPDVRWLSLLDGHPLVARTRGLGVGEWPRLAGSDLIEELLDRSATEGISVGFLGGSAESHERLSMRIADRWPHLKVAGYWAPERAEIVDPARARSLARSVAEARVELLFVGLGKPRQELWIAEYGALTGAGALLAFGASADFVSGTVRRAPAWVAEHGLEWLWRLGMEPRRLARRYLVQGPGAYLDVRSRSRTVPAAEPVVVPRQVAPAIRIPRPRVAERPLVTAIVVTYNSAAHVGDLLGDLAAQDGTAQLRTVVVDNGSTDDTCAIVRAAGLVPVEGHGNIGYAGGVNVGLRARDTGGDAVLVLNPDLRLADDAIDSMWRTMSKHGAGIVVPRMLDGDGEVYPSLRFEPSLLGGMCDAVLGARLPHRRAGLTDIDRDPASYQFSHPVSWATGAALLVKESVVRSVGEWNEEFFLYCEETDYFRRARQAGETVWFDSGAVVQHHTHGSGSSAELDALMAVNRVRYAERHHTRPYASAMRSVAVVNELVRVPTGGTHPRALRHLVDRRSWDRLPKAAVPPAVPQPREG